MYVYLFQFHDLAGSKAFKMDQVQAIVRTGSLVADVDKHLPRIAVSRRFKHVLVDVPTVKTE